jgi:hypothetical protein
MEVVARGVRWIYGLPRDESVHRNVKIEGMRALTDISFWI